MKIYLLRDPKMFSCCARFSHTGTWSSGALCRKCGQPTSILVEPLQIEWEPDSELVCDFSWCGYTAVIKTSLGRHLQKKGFELSLNAVDVVEPLKKSKKKIVSFPYVGPEIGWLKLSEQIALNEKKSCVELVIECDECNQKKYSFKSEGIIIDRENWLGQKAFHIEQFTRSKAMFVTEELVELFKNLEISNVAFSEAGEIE